MVFDNEVFSKITHPHGPPRGMYGECRMPNFHGTGLPSKYDLPQAIWVSLTNLGFGQSMKT